MEQGKLKDALEEIFERIPGANKYFDTKAPWITRNTDMGDCANTLYQCVLQLVSFAILLEPFLPFSSEVVLSGFDLNREWGMKQVIIGSPIPNLDLLFQRRKSRYISFLLTREKMYNINKKPQL